MIHTLLATAQDPNDYDWHTAVVVGVLLFTLVSVVYFSTRKPKPAKARSGGVKRG